jgi:hypothetical protein
MEHLPVIPVETKLVIKHKNWYSQN